MNLFPLTIVDNFYENPGLIRDFALSQDYYDTDDGRWPGKRSDRLSETNYTLFQNFCTKLFSLYFNLNVEEISWTVETSFQIVTKFSDSPDDIRNEGWIHTDGDSLMAGIIYLNPTGNYGGTSFYQQKQNYPPSQHHLNQKCKLYLGEEIDLEEYTQAVRETNSAFIETASAKNVFNRLVLFDYKTPHGVPTYYYDGDEPRLTQTFFVKNLTLPYTDQYPLKRG